MKVLLPAVPAFLLCFAGGMLLPGKNPPDTLSPSLVLPPMEVGGYGEWKDKMAEWATDADKAGDAAQRLTKLKNEGEILASMKTDIEKAAGNIGIAKTRLENTQAAIAQRKKELEEVSVNLNAAREAFEKVRNRVEEPDKEQMNFKQRLEWKTAYDAAGADYKQAQDAYDKKKKDLDLGSNNPAPGGIGGGDP